MLEMLGLIFNKIIETMQSVLIFGQITLLDFSIGLTVFGLATAAFRAIFAAGGDK